MHNGAALYAKDAGKLDGLASEAYIQPQDNILDNGYFEVNQQNETEYVGSGYTVDRWQMSINRGKLNVNDGYVTLTCTSAEGAQYFRQPFEILFQEGDELTLAVMLRGNGQGQMFLGDSETGANIGGGLSFTPTDSWEVYIKTIKIGNKIPKYFTLACVGQNAHFDIKRAKTEYGPYFTGWPVWNYALELAKCQRYQFNLSGDFIVVSATGANLASIFVSMPVTMRKTPVVKDFSIQSIALDGQSYNAEDFTYSHIFNDKDHTHLLINLAPKVTLPRGKVGTIRLSTMLDANL